MPLRSRPHERARPEATSAAKDSLKVSSTQTYYGTPRKRPFFETPLVWHFLRQLTRSVTSTERSFGYSTLGTDRRSCHQIDGVPMEFSPAPKSCRKCLRTNRHESVAASSELTELIATNASNRPVAVMRRGSRSREEQHFWESSVEQADEQPRRVVPVPKTRLKAVLIPGTC